MEAAPEVAVAAVALGAAGPMVDAGGQTREIGGGQTREIGGKTD